MQPTRALDAAQPFMPAESSNLVSKKPIAPAMTAVSYPNSNPPTAATEVTR